MMMMVLQWMNTPEMPPQLGVRLSATQHLDGAWRNKASGWWRRGGWRLEFLGRPWHQPGQTTPHNNTSALLRSQKENISSWKWSGQERSPRMANEQRGAIALRKGWELSLGWKLKKFNLLQHQADLQSEELPSSTPPRTSPTPPPQPASLSRGIIAPGVIREVWSHPCWLTREGMAALPSLHQQTTLPPAPSKCQPNIRCGSGTYKSKLENAIMYF